MSKRATRAGAAAEHLPTFVPRCGDSHQIRIAVPPMEATAAEECLGFPATCLRDLEFKITPSLQFLNARYATTSIPEALCL